MNPVFWNKPFEMKLQHLHCLLMMHVLLNEIATQHVRRCGNFETLKMFARGNKAALLFEKRGITPAIVQLSEAAGRNGTCF